MKSASPMAAQRTPVRQPAPAAGRRRPAAQVAPANDFSPVSGSGMAELRDLKTGQSWRIERDTVIGREQVGADLVLPDTNVSRRHAQLTFDGTAWSVEDLGSTNGTLVNGQRVSRAALHSGDTLTLGLSDLAFKEL